MASARIAYNKCIEDRISGNVAITDDNNFSQHALTVYIMTATALEAFINEVCLGPTSKMINKAAIPLEMVEDMEIRRKYYLLPLLLWGRTFDRGAQPYQDFDILMRLRNALVHYKMKSFAGSETPKYFQWLRDKGLLITTGKLDADYAWLHQLSNSKAALWAYNTTCQMANKLIEFGDETTKTLWRGMLDNFQEIPDQYWRSLIPSSKPTSKKKY